jgi:hypothetical protein
MDGKFAAAPLFLHPTTGWCCLLTLTQRVSRLGKAQQTRPKPDDPREADISEAMEDHATDKELSSNAGVLADEIR